MKMMVNDDDTSVKQQQQSKEFFEATVSVNKEKKKEVQKNLKIHDRRERRVILMLLSGQLIFSDSTGLFANCF